MKWKNLLPLAGFPVLLTLGIAMLAIIHLVPYGSLDKARNTGAKADGLDEGVGLQPVVEILAPIQVAEGRSFRARVSISNVTGFDACNYDITYDSLVLDLIDVTPGRIGRTSIPVNVWQDVSPGTLRIVQNIPGVGGVSGSGYLCQVHFQVTGAAGDTSAIALENAVWSDRDAEAIASDCVHACVRIGTALEADFVGESDEALVGQTVGFIDKTCGGSPPYSYSWDFDGDGVVDASSGTPTVEYAEAGTYSVTLTVTDYLGDSATRTAADCITVHPGLTADFSVSQEETGAFPAFRFIDASTGGKSPRSCAWDLDGDGQTDSTAPDLSHTYTAAGVYPVTLTASDALGNTSVQAKIILLYDAREGDITATQITELERAGLDLEQSANGVEVIIAEFP